MLALGSGETAEFADGDAVELGDGEGVELDDDEGDGVGVGAFFFAAGVALRCFRGVGVGPSKNFLTFCPRDSSSSVVPRVSPAIASPIVIAIKTTNRSLGFTSRDS